MIYKHTHCFVKSKINLHLEDGRRGKPRRERSASTADPGTITGWIVANERGVPLLAELSYVWDVMNHFYSTTCQMTVRRRRAKIRWQIHSVLGDDSLCPFLRLQLSVDTTSKKQTQPK